MIQPKPVAKKVEKPEKAKIEKRVAPNKRQKVEEEKVPIVKIAKKRA